MNDLTIEESVNFKKKAGGKPVCTKILVEKDRKPRSTKWGIMWAGYN
jgi:hypothetical protein